VRIGEEAAMALELDEIKTIAKVMADADKQLAADLRSEQAAGFSEVRGAIDVLRAEVAGLKAQLATATELVALRNSVDALKAGGGLERFAHPLTARIE
jgi:hypothetical protein